MHGQATRDRSIEFLIEEADTSAHGRSVAAFFDLDRTLIAGYSAVALLLAQLASGETSRRQLLGRARATIRWATGHISLADLIGSSTSLFAGRTPSEFAQFAQNVFARQLADTIYPEARRLIQAHRSAGHTLAIISSATSYQVAPVAKALGIDLYRSTRLACEAGRLNGRIIEPACCGEGKAEAGRAFARALDLDLEKSFFYTDSHEDAPLLELVGRPRPVNPNRALRRLARERNWPAVQFAPIRSTRGWLRLFEPCRISLRPTNERRRRWTATPS